MKRLIQIFIPSLLIVPSLALAQLSGTENLIVQIGVLVNRLTVIVVGIALLVFFWGLTKFILSAGSEVDKQKGKDLMIYGVIALFVMVSIWGLVSFIQDELFPGADYNTPNWNLTPFGN